MTKKTKEEETNENIEENNISEDVSPLTDEIIEVEWEEIEMIYNLKRQVENFEKQYAEMCLHYEKTKANMMARILKGESLLFQTAESLRNSKNVDSNCAYELKLPTSPSEKGYFLRKDNTS